MVPKPPRDTLTLGLDRQLQLTNCHPDPRDRSRGRGAEGPTFLRDLPGVGMKQSTVSERQCLQMRPANVD